ncbi:MAG: ABC transporter ATP-binding protein [Acidimicrobiia bacterium]|nr:ABC transporter ATP-binding protein [Acidimicrobiia bacterium]NNF87704.1 ABC transporter ATP-binding protein [Acidimicrobiia bacterium]
MSQPIEARDVTLRYRLDRANVGTIKEAAVRTIRRQRKVEWIHALDGVSFEVARGEIFAVVGPNGAGKSTLMKVIARVLPPTTGRVIVRGQVAPMIELGSGMNPELTARENIILYGSMLGRDPRHMRERVGPIVEWAGVEEFVDVPTRSYSSGMMGRLAFSVATDIEPEVLVVDEVLSVGDKAFRAKSQARMNQLINGGSAVVVVSHSIEMLKNLATRAMWLDRGRIKMLGPADEVLGGYQTSG